MAAKKKEGLEGIKDTTGGKRREDRESIDRTVFDPLSIDAKNVLTVVCLLQSPEEIVQLRAVASLEVFASKDQENLELLCSLNIFDDIFPILKHPDFIARRFTAKLIALLSSLKDFRAQMLKKGDILECFVDILKRENDAVLQEYSSLTLAELSKDHQVASELLKVKDCLATLFLRLISADPDIEKNCLDIIIHLLNDINGIDIFVESPYFEMNTLLNLISSSYPVIQASVIEVLTVLTSWCRDTRILFNFRDVKGAEVVLSILEKREYADLHPGALDLMINVTDCPELCEYLQKSGCLQRFIRILDNATETVIVEKIVGVLARMGQTIKGREALHSEEMEKRFINYLQVPNDDVLEPACLGIANLSQNVNSLEVLLPLNPVKILIGIAVDGEKKIKLRNMAAYALNIMSNADKRIVSALVEDEDYKGLFPILKENSSVSTELCQNVIQVFIGISVYEDLRIGIVCENFLSALMSCLPCDSCIRKDPGLQVDTLECLTQYLTDSEAHYIFNEVGGVDALLHCLRSKFASVREWAGHLVVIASQCGDFVQNFIQKDGLEWMLKEKNTMYSMPSWQSAIETLFSNYLPAKFAYTGRLDLNDITRDGFYISTNPKVKFVVLDYFLEKMLSPMVPIYVANFNTPRASSTQSESTSTSEISQVQETPKQNSKENVNLKKYMKGAGRNSLEPNTWKGSLLSYDSVDYVIADNNVEEHVLQDNFPPDSNLSKYLENLKKKLMKEEADLEYLSWFCLHPRIIRNRARIIAEFVAEEMSGLEPNVECTTHYKIAHINEIKYYLGTNIIPLGLIRMGDYIERAMLFKVLADRTGFPCALVRGPYGRAWVEIAIPVMNVEEPEEANGSEKLSSDNLTPAPQKSKDIVSSESEKYDSQRSSESPCESVIEEENFWFPKIHLKEFTSFPKDYLKPNAIVDLVIQPGRILNINSLEANEYCGAFLF